MWRHHEDKHDAGLHAGSLGDMLAEEERTPACTPAAPHRRVGDDDADGQRLQRTQHGPDSPGVIIFNGERHGQLPALSSALGKIIAMIS